MLSELNRNRIVVIAFVFDTTIIYDTFNIVDTINNTDSLFIYDTTTIIDTFNVIDTVFNLDTLIISDTVFSTDTVIVIVPDSSGSLMQCARLASHLKEIVWMFSNEANNFNLEFSASISQEEPARNLIIDINGETYLWTPENNKRFSIELYLDEDSQITINTDRPSSFGHDIDICLTLTPED